MQKVAIAKTTILTLLLLQSLSVHADSLLAKATQITDTQGWYLGRYGKYGWLSDHEVLFFRDPIVLPPKIDHKPDGTILMEGGTSYGGKICVFDLHNKQEHPLPTFSPLFTKENGLLDSVSISPDGMRIYWAGEKGARLFTRSLTDCHNGGSGCLPASPMSAFRSPKFRATTCACSGNAISTGP